MIRYDEIMDDLDKYYENFKDTSMSHTTNIIKIYNDNCLIYAMKLVVDDENIIDKIKLKFSEAVNVDIKFLREIGLEHGICFIIYNMDDDNVKIKRKTNHGKRGEERMNYHRVEYDKAKYKIHLNLYLNHYLLEERIPGITLENLRRIGTSGEKKAMENIGKRYYFDKQYSVYRWRNIEESAKNNYEVSSRDAIRYLVNNNRLKHMSL